MRRKKSITSGKVLVGGCFDLIHFGHIHFLKKAKALGNHLTVALESDENTKRLKGPTRPIHNQNQRREMLESLGFVDKVIILSDIMQDVDYLKLVQEVRPDTIAVTLGDPALKKKKAHAARVGARVIEIPPVKVSSTSKIAKLLGIE